MTLPNPKFAPRRNDLPWLRRRRRPKAAVTTTAVSPPRPQVNATRPATTSTASPPRSTAPTGSTGSKIDYTRHDRSTTRPAASPPAPAPTPAPTPPPAPPRREPAPAASSGSSLDLSAPTPTPAAPPAPPSRSETLPHTGDPLDLSAPSTPPSTPPAPAPTPAASTTSLDLDLGGSAPPAPPAPPPSSTTSLDLGAPPEQPASRASRQPAPPPAATERHHVTRRTRRGASSLLDFGHPVVTLDRLQSGIGQLTLDAVVGDEVGDLRIGAAWALVDGRTGIVELDSNRRHGPDSRNPVVLAQREGRFERIAIDLRQTTVFQRLLVYGFSPSRQSLTWGGSVVVTTYGGARIDAPIVSAPSPAVMALVSVYNVGGELVVRAEMDPVSGSVRDTCRAFGYDRITWLDDRTPVA